MKFNCSYTKLVKMDDLKEHPKNRNQHSERQITALAKIIAKTGQRSPVVVSNLSSFIVKGHGRLSAIKLLGWEKVAVDYQDYKDDYEEFQDRIADNEIARYAEFDKAGFIDDLSEMEVEEDDVDFDEFGLLDFTFDIFESEGIDDSDDDKKDDPKQFIVEIKYDNDMDARDLYDDLISKNIPARFIEK